MLRSNASPSAMLDHLGLGRGSPVVSVGNCSSAGRGVVHVQILRRCAAAIGAPRIGPAVGRACWRRRLDPPGDELGVVLDETEQRRAARVLPGRPRKYRPGMSLTPRRWREPAVPVGDVEIDPGVVGPVAGRPDDGVDVELRAVGEAHRPPRAADRPRPERDTDRRLSSRGLEPMSVSRSRARRPEPRVDALVEQAQPRQPREQVASEQPLRQRGLPRADGKVHGVRRRQLLGDLKAGVAAADDEDRAAGHAARAAIGGAVRLEQRRVQLVGQRRHARDVERPGGDDDLVGRDAPAVRELEDEAVVARPAATAPGCGTGRAGRTSRAYCSR